MLEFNKNFYKNHVEITVYCTWNFVDHNRKKVGAELV
jgi:hypothetical protein